MEHKATESYSNLGLALRKRLEQVAERPCLLLDAGAVVAVDRAWAATVVPLNGPDRELGQLVRSREPLDPAGVWQVRDLGLLRVIVDAGQERNAFKCPK